MQTERSLVALVALSLLFELKEARCGGRRYWNQRSTGWSGVSCQVSLRKNNLGAEAEAVAGSARPPLG